jgi:low affinity Fe/Cu permease
VKPMTTHRMFTRLAQATAAAAGHPVSFALAVVVVIVWGASGRWFGYSDTWQLVINTGTTIVTFWMVFLIQSSQNRDTKAIQGKLDALIKASDASNAFLRLEQRDEDEIRRARDGL